MTARDTAAADVIAEGVPHHDGCTDWTPEDDFFCWCKGYRREVAEAALAALSAAGYVVATREEIRMWPVEDVAELIGGEVLERPFKSNLDERGYVWCEAVHGPWVEVRDV